MHISIIILHNLFQLSYLDDYNNILSANSIRPLTLDELITNDIGERQFQFLYKRVEHDVLIDHAIRTSNINLIRHLWDNHGPTITNKLSSTNNNDVLDLIVELHVDGRLYNPSIISVLDSCMRYDLVDKVAHLYY